MNLKFNNEMDILKQQTLFVCGCCKQSFPTEAFYIHKKTGLPDNYCKECRKSSSRAHRKTEKHALAKEKEEDYPVITRIEDPVLRGKLLRHACQIVAARVERKRRKRYETDPEWAGDE